MASRFLKRTLACFWLVCLGGLATGSISGCVPGCAPTAELLEKTVQVQLDGRWFTLELALDGAARYQGLSDRDSIASDGGMLFVFENAAERTFVMRRCLVSLDILFLGPGGEIVSMAHMPREPYDRLDAQLTAYRSGWPAQFVIELAGGTLKQLSLKPGQKVKLPLTRLKKRVRSSDKL